MILWARQPGSESQIYHFQLCDLGQVTSPLWALVSEIWRGPYRIYSHGCCKDYIRLSGQQHRVSAPQMVGTVSPGLWQPGLLSIQREVSVS